jgi:hypothetical protein
MAEATTDDFYQAVQTANDCIGEHRLNAYIWIMSIYAGRTTPAAASRVKEVQEVVTRNVG